MEAANRVATAPTDIDLRAFCSLTYAQALLDYSIGHRDERWWYDYDIGCLPRCDDQVLLKLPGCAQSECVCRVRISLGTWKCRRVSPA